MIKAVQRIRRTANDGRTRTLLSRFLARSGSKRLPFRFDGTRHLRADLLSAELAKRNLGRLPSHLQCIGLKREARNV